MEGSNYDLTVGSGKLITELKVVELKAELESRGQNKYGNKKELLERLRAVSLFVRLFVLLRGRTVCNNTALLFTMTLYKTFHMYTGLACRVILFFTLRFTKFSSSCSKLLLQLHPVLNCYAKFRPVVCRYFAWFYFRGIFLKWAVGVVGLVFTRASADDASQALLLVESVLGVAVECCVFSCRVLLETWLISHVMQQRVSVGLLPGSDGSTAHGNKNSSCRAVSWAGRRPLTILCTWQLVLHTVPNIFCLAHYPLQFVTLAVSWTWIQTYHSLAHNIGDTGHGMPVCISCPRKRKR